MLHEKGRLCPRNQPLKNPVRLAKIIRPLVLANPIPVHVAVDREEGEIGTVQTVPQIRPAKHSLGMMLRPIEGSPPMISLRTLVKTLGYRALQSLGEQKELHLLRHPARNR